MYGVRLLVLSDQSLVYTTGWLKLICTTVWPQVTYTTERHDYSSTANRVERTLSFSIIYYKFLIKKSKHICIILVTKLLNEKLVIIKMIEIVYKLQFAKV